MKKIIAAKVKIGHATVIEFDIYDGDVVVDTHCHVKFPDGYIVGGYTNIPDAMAHKAEWFGMEAN